MSRQNSINRIAKKYAHEAVLKGNELLLAPASALLLLDELELSQIAIAGVTAWIRVTLQDGSIGIAEELTHFHNIATEGLAPESNLAISESIHFAKNHIIQILGEVDYVSIDLYAPLSWNLPDK